MGKKENNQMKNQKSLWSIVFFLEALSLGIFPPFLRSCCSQCSPIYLLLFL